MENNYSVFYDQREIAFLPGRPNIDSNFDIVTEHPVSWDLFMRFVEAGKGSLYCISNDPGRSFRQFATFFHFVGAAGGLVSDPTNYWLFIFRKGRWDLPKGFTEAGESPERAAIREVEEECGINNLRIIAQLPDTYHVYLDGESDWALKKTSWFFMKTGKCCQAEPQTSEGITKALWKHPDDLAEILGNTYGNIRELLSVGQRYRQNHKRGGSTNP